MILPDYEAPKSALGNGLEALGGGLVGGFQGLSDIGANVAQFPSDIYSWATGNEGYHAPKPDFRGYSPNTPVGRTSEKVGEFLSPLATPGLAAEAFLGKAMYGGRLLPRLLTEAFAGAAESENRPLGAAFGLAGPAIGKVAREVKDTPFTKKSATNRLGQAASLAEERGVKDIPVPLDTLRNLEYLMKSPELRPTKVGLSSLLGDAAKGDYGSYRSLQSALKDIERELRGKNSRFSVFPPQSTAAERLSADQLNKVTKGYLSSTRKHLESTGASDVSNLERLGNQDYARYMKFNKLRKNLTQGLILSGLGLGGLHHFHPLFK